MPIINKLPTTGSSGGGTGNKMNIFVQPTEPDIKEGIWVQTDQINGLDIVVVPDMSDLPSDYDYTQMTDVPYTTNASLVGTDAYLFHSSTCYKYDTLSNTHTQMANPTANTSDGATISIGTDIYLFGGGTSCYKYDTLTDTYVERTDIPYTFNNGSVASVDSSGIYLFGSVFTTARRYTYLHCTNWQSLYTKSKDIPYDFYRGSVASVDSSGIYLFGGPANNRRNCYRYIPGGTGTYTYVSTIPESFSSYGSTSVIGTDIYLFSDTNCYKYDTLTNMYTKIPSTLPQPMKSKSSAVTVDPDMFVFQGTNCYKFHKTTNLSFDRDTLVIINGTDDTDLYQTQFYQLPPDTDTIGVNRMTSGFDDASLYVDNTEVSSPIYYGDGEQWIKFKN